MGEMFVIVQFVGIIQSVYSLPSAFNIAAQNTTWTNASSICQHGVAGGSALGQCQPETCEPTLLTGLINGIKKDPHQEQIMWLNGQVQRSPLMQYTGCYEISRARRRDTVNAVTFNKFFDDNGVLKCSLYCKSVRTDDFILLLNDSCYCLHKATRKLWSIFSQTFKRTKPGFCDRVCPGDENDLCGGNTETTSSIYLSVYEYVQDPLPAPIFKTLGQICYAIEPLGHPKKRKIQHCKEKLHFRCQINKATRTTCHTIRLNWYQANRQCMRDGAYLQTHAPLNDLCTKNKNVNSVVTWFGYFYKEKITWDRPNDNLDKNDSCLALKVTNGNTYELITPPCFYQYPPLCKTHDEVTTLKGQGEKTEDTMESSSYASPTATISREEKDDIMWFLIGGLSGIILIFVFVFIGWRSIKRRSQNIPPESVYDEINDINLEDANIMIPRQELVPIENRLSYEHPYQPLSGDRESEHCSQYQTLEQTSYHEEHDDPQVEEEQIGIDNLQPFIDAGYTDALSAC